MQKHHTYTTMPTRQFESPFVSVIVPVFNGEASVCTLLEALARQDYPPDRHEVIIVDNGSTDGTISRIQDAVTLFDGRLVIASETERRGSYAARNRGLGLAKGEIIAFTDADCTPVEGWLAAGVDCLVSSGADLAGGKVTFIFASDKPSAAEIVDSRSNMQMERDIALRGVTKTANLFTWQRVIDAVGPFDPTLMSGGDVLWSSHATQSGFKLLYAPEAEVFHPARNWQELFEKQVRVGRGQVPLLRRAGLNSLEILVDGVVPRRQRSKNPHKGNFSPPQVAVSPLALFAARLWIQGATFLGRLQGMLGSRS